MPLDLRTRDDASPMAPLDPVEFLDHTLPARFAESAELVAPGLALLAPRPLVLEVVGREWTLTAGETGEAAVRPGNHPDGGHLELTAEQLDDLVHDQVTMMGLWSGGRIDIARTRLGDLQHWGVALRGAVDGVAIHTPGAVALELPDGAPLDLTRSFEAGDDPAEMGRFLEAAGFLHLRGLFTRGEMEQVSRDMDAAAGRYSPEDGRSWWARTGDGESRLVRMQYFDGESDTVAAILADDRFLRLADLTGCGHIPRPHNGANRIEALFKPIGVVEGISDVPWHKDCSLGRHSYECCGMTVGISVTGAGPTSGQLRVVAGSHRALVWPALLQPGLDLPQIDLPTETGDITLHLSCTLHMAQPPTARARRVMYTSFTLPPFDPVAATAGRRRLGAIREAAPVTVSQPAAPRDA